MDKDILIYWLLLAAGILLVAAAIVWRKHLAGRQVIDVSLEKLGIVLRADAFGLLVVTGVAFVGPAIYFVHDLHDTQLAKMQETLTETQNKVLDMEGVIKELKGYDLRLNLRFPDSAPPSPFTTRVTQYVHRRGESADHIYDPATKPDAGVGGIVVYFDGLSAGDRLYVTAENQGRQWRSDNFTIPSAQLVMSLLPE